MGKKNKDTGFSTPDGYFDKLTDRIMDRIGQEADGMSKNGGFKVPEGYFNSLSEKILEKEQKPEPKVVKLYPYRKFLMTAASIAAVVVIFIGLQWQGEQGLSFEDIASLELEEYFDQNSGAITTYEIAELMPLDELEVNDILESEWNDDNIVEYLDEEIDDIDELNLTDDE